MYRRCPWPGVKVQDVPVVPPEDDDVPAVVLEPSATERAFAGLLKLISLKQFIDSLIGMTNMGFQVLAICNTMAERKHSCGR